MIGKLIVHLPPPTSKYHRMLHLFLITIKLCEWERTLWIHIRRPYCDVRGDEYEYGCSGERCAAGKALAQSSLRVKKHPAVVLKSPQSSADTEHCQKPGSDFERNCPRPRLIHFDWGVAMLIFKIRGTQRVDKETDTATPPPQWCYGLGIVSLPVQPRQKPFSLQ